MTSHRRRNAPRSAHGFRPDIGKANLADGTEWLWGWHPATAALANPARGAPKRLLATAERARQLAQRFGERGDVEVVEPSVIAQVLPAGVAHQGIAIRIAPPQPLALEDLASEGRLLLMLDQVTDPQNVGAIFRSAAAFGADGIILQDRNAPPLSGSLAKVSAGGVDMLPHARVVNLSRALEKLADLGWRAVGLDARAEGFLEEVLDGRPTVIVLGSEGEGLRRLVSEHCDALAAIPMPGGFESLNVAAACAVALYEASRKRG